MRLAVFVVLLASQSLLGNSLDYEPFEENGKIGLRDGNGQVVIPPTFEGLGWSDKSFSIVGSVTGYKLNNQWGLINLKTELLTKAEYIELTYAGGDRIIARKKIDALREKTGCLNLDGDVAIPIIYDGIKINGLRGIAFTREGSLFRFGLIDLHGKILIPLKYRSITAIGDLRFAVEDAERKMALFSEGGAQMTDFSIDSISSFTGGKAIIYENFNQGLMARDGNILIEPKYREINVTTDGVWVKKSDQWSIMDHQGKEYTRINSDQVRVEENGFHITQWERHGLTDGNMIPKVPTTYRYLSSFDNGIAVAAMGRKYGVVRTNNTIVVPFEYDSIFIRDPFIYLRKDILSEETWSLADHFGIVKSKRFYEEMRPFSDGLFVVRSQGFYGAINRYGEEIIRCVFDSILDIKADQILVKFKNNYGIIDRDENWVLTPQPYPLELVDRNHYIQSQPTVSFFKKFPGEIIYFSSNPLKATSQSLIETLPNGFERKISFDGLTMGNSPDAEGMEFVLSESEGFRGIKKNGKYGFVDSEGRLLIANRYEEIGPFNGGFAPIRIIGRWGFVNTRDEIAVNPSFQAVSPFKNGVSIVKRADKLGLINTQGEIILPILYDTITRLEDNYFVIAQNNHQGLADPKGIILIDTRFDKIQYLYNGFVIVSMDLKFGTLTLDGLNTIPMIYDDLVYDLNNDRYLALQKAAWAKAP